MGLLSSDDSMINQERKELTSAELFSQNLLQLSSTNNNSSRLNASNTLNNASATRGRRLSEVSVVSIDNIVRPVRNTIIQSSYCCLPLFRSHSEYLPSYHNNKKVLEFKKLRLLHTYSSHIGPIWCMKFSYDNRFLATGGQDSKIIIWNIGNKVPNLASGSRPAARGVSVASEDIDEVSDESSSTYTEDYRAASSKHTLLNTTPYHIWLGHSGDITDVSWSQSYFVLSASTDKTVRLWNIFRCIYCSSILCTL
jgi:WD40 repeat protein